MFLIGALGLAQLALADRAHHCQTEINVFTHGAWKRGVWSFHCMAERGLHQTQRFSFSPPSLPQPVYRPWIYTSSSLVLHPSIIFLTSCWTRHLSFSIISFLFVQDDSVDLHQGCLPAGLFPWIRETERVGQRRGPVAFIRLGCYSERELLQEVTPVFFLVSEVLIRSEIQTRRNASWCLFRLNLTVFSVGIYCFSYKTISVCKCLCLKHVLWFWQFGPNNPTGFTGPRSGLDYLLVMTLDFRLHVNRNQLDLPLKGRLVLLSCWL